MFLAQTLTLKEIKRVLQNRLLMSQITRQNSRKTNHASVNSSPYSAADAKIQPIILKMTTLQNPTKTRMNEKWRRSMVMVN
jgi:hypothetical protein